MAGLALGVLLTCLPAAGAPPQVLAASPRADVPAVASPPDASGYQIGPNDLLAVSVFQAPELNASVRVSDAGEISLPLLGSMRAAGLTPVVLETQIEDALRAKYMRDPDVSVQVTELHSQPVSVLGAVNKPGVFQVRGRHTLLDVLSLAGGLADDAGTTVTIVRKGSGAQGGGQDGVPASGSTDAAAGTVTLEVSLDDVDTRGVALDVPILPGDVVRVRTAGVVYVVGAVKKPGSFSMRGSHSPTVLRALAVAEGFTSTASKRGAVVIRTDERGERIDLAVDFDAILKGKHQDLPLQPADVLFVPVSGGKAVARVTIDALTRVVTFRGVID